MHETFFLLFSVIAAEPTSLEKSQPVSLMDTVQAPASSLVDSPHAAASSLVGTQPLPVAGNKFKKHKKKSKWIGRRCKQHYAK